MTKNRANRHYIDGGKMANRLILMVGATRSEKSAIERAAKLAEKNRSRFIVDSAIESVGNSANKYALDVGSGRPQIGRSIDRVVRFQVSISPEKKELIDKKAKKTGLTTVRFLASRAVAAAVELLEENGRTPGVKQRVRREKKTPIESNEPKRPRGRPRKYPIVKNPENNAPRIKTRGRPKKPANAEPIVRKSLYFSGVEKSLIRAASKTVGLAMGGFIAESANIVATNVATGKNGFERLERTDRRGEIIVASDVKSHVDFVTQVAKKIGVTLSEFYADNALNRAAEIMARAAELDS